MPEFKPGDGAWKRVAVVWSHIDGHIAVNSEHGRDHYPADESELLLPDVPHLERIARYLADHPETVEALEDISVGYENPRFGLWADGFEPQSFMRDMKESQPNSRLGLMLKPATHIWLHGLLRAMRGEEGS